MFLKNVFSYSLVNFYAQIVRLLQELVVRFMLPPEVLGLWSLVLVIQNFSLNFDWGVTTAASRELPLLFGAKQFQDAADYRLTSFYLHLLGKLIISIGIVLYGLIYYLHPFQKEFIATLAAAIIIFIFGLGEAFTTFYQSAQQYILLSKRLFIYWSFYAFLMIAGALLYGVNGLMIAMIVALILQAAILRHSLDYEGKGTFRADYVTSILGFALPFRLVDFPLSIATSLDAVYVAKFFDLKTLAIYTTAKMIFNQAGQVPTWIGSVLIMRLTTLVGAANSKLALGREMLTSLTAINLILLPLLIGFISLTSYWGILLFLPKYSYAIKVLPLLLLSLYFQPRVTVIRNYWIIDKKFKWLAISNLIVISLMGLGYAVLYLLDDTSLITVAAVYTLSFAGYFAFVAICLGRELWGAKKLVKFLIETLFSLSVLVLAMEVSGLLSAVPMRTNMMSIIKTVLYFFGTISLLVIYGAWCLRKEINFDQILSRASGCLR